MKTLIVEDDFTSRLLLQKIMTSYGESHIAINGLEAVHAFEVSLLENEPYDLICMDIMMPEMDGHSALKEIRQIEAQRGIEAGDGVKVMMTTALNDIRNVSSAYREFCDSYMVKPIDKTKLVFELRTMGLIY
jgi:two-component system chemotaxis response regulator CheY